MRQIYAAAETTIVWLGKQSLESEVVFADCIYAYSDSSPKYKDADRTIVKRKRKTLKAANNVYQAPSRDRLSAAVREVLSRDWFSRVWILQEAAVSKKVRVQCGSQTVGLNELLDRASILGLLQGSHGMAILSGTKDISWYERLQSLATLIRSSVSAHADTDRLQLLSLLNYFRRFDSTKAVDKLFALYGLAQNNVKQLQLYPDRSLPPEKVYTDATFAIIQGSQSLSVLDVPWGHADLRERLPSWVPDWTDTSRFGEGLTPETQAERQLFEQSSELAKKHLEGRSNRSKHVVHLRNEDDPFQSRFFWFLRTGSGGQPPVQRFNASKGTVLSHVSSAANEVLSLEGLFFDNVTEIGNVMHEWTGVLSERETRMAHLKDWYSLGYYKRFVEIWSGPISTLDEISRWKERLVVQDQTSYPLGESRDLAFLQTICAGSLPSAEKSMGNHLWGNDVWVEIFDNRCRSWLTGRKYLPLVRILSFGPTKAMRDVAGIVWQIYVSGFMNGAIFALAQAAAPTFRRRIGRTSKGYFALLPDESALGDNIAILKGGRLPLVMRERGDTFQLTGRRMCMVSCLERLGM